MKKTAPYVLFVLVLLLLFWLGARWYLLRNQTKLSSNQLGEGVTIENLSEGEMRKALGGVKDYETVSLTKVQPTGNLTPQPSNELNGVVRYEVTGGKLKLGVIVTVADESQTSLQAWIRKPDGDDVKPLFVLEKGKGGLVGSAQLDASLLPLEILISAGTGTPQNSLILKGTITAPVSTNK